MYIPTATVLPINKDHSFNTKKLSFKRLLPQSANIKLAFFDVDETLINWAEAPLIKLEQKYRNRLFTYLSQHKILSVYSSDRGFSGIMPLIEKRILTKPDYIVGNNGGHIYKKNGKGIFHEITDYSASIIEKFDKNRLRQIMAKIANQPENMFTKEEWARVPTEIIPDGQAEFRGSKITEYVGQESPTNIRFALAPGMYKQNIEKIETTLRKNGFEPFITFFHYQCSQVSEMCLQKYVNGVFTKQHATDLANHYMPRTYPDGSGDAIMISATDKGTASEYLRKIFRLEKNEVFATGDGENDFGHVEQGYFFGLISNATDGLRKKISLKTPNDKIINSNSPGVEGIIDILI